MRPKFLVVAETHRPHGLSGEIEVSSLTDFPERFVEGALLYPSPPVNGRERLIIERVKETPRGMILKFEGIDTREEAERIAKHSLVVPVEEAAKLPEGDIWVHDLIGIEVFTANGEFLGTVIDVLRTGSNDVYVVQNEREYLIPAINDIVKEISVEDKKMVIQPIPGLLE